MKESSKLIISLACLTQLMHLLLRAFVLHWDVFLLFLNRGVLESQKKEVVVLRCHAVCRLHVQVL